MLQARRSRVLCWCVVIVVGASSLTSRGLAETEEVPVPRTERAVGLSADELARRASATSLLAEEKRHELEAARAQLSKAIVDYVPRLGGSVSYMRLSPVSNPPIGTVVFAPGAVAGPLSPDQPLAAAPLSLNNLDHQITLTGTLGVPVSDYVFRLVHAHRAAEAQLGAAEHILAATRRKVDFDARALYYAWVRAELDAEVARKDLELGREHLAQLSALAAAESASEADVARVSASVAGSELVLERAQNLARLELERCRIAMHDDGERSYEIGEDLSAIPPAPVDLRDLDALVRAAQDARPELHALSAQVRAQQQLAKVARAQTLPRIDLTGQIINANPNQRYLPPQDEFRRTWQVGVQYSHTLSDVLVGRRQARSAEARRAALDAQRRGLLDAVRAEVVEAVLAHRNASAGIDTSSRRLSAAQASYTARRERFLAGKATLVELTEAQTELFCARLEAVQAQVAIRVANARVAYATGATI